MTVKNYSAGLVSISFRKHSPKEILIAMNKAGLSCIEWGSDVHAPYNDTEKLNEISRLQKEYGISCSSYGTYFRLGISPIGELQNYIDAAKILGTDILRVWCYTKKKADMTQKEHDFLMNECKLAADIAEKNNVTICLECHRDTFTEKCADSVYLMEKINSPNFRMYWQPFQWQTFEENMENAKKIAPYARHLHVFNWENSKRFPLAEAKDAWCAYIGQFSKPRTLLLEFMPDDTIEELDREAATLRNIIGGLV